MQQSVKPKYLHNLAWTLVPIQVCFIMPYLRMLYNALSREPVMMNQELLYSLFLFGALDLIYVVWLLARRVTRIDADAEILKITRMLGRTITARYREITLTSGKLNVGRRYSIRLGEIANAEAIRDLVTGRVKVVMGADRHWAWLFYVALLLMILFMASVAVGLIPMGFTSWALFSFFGLFAAITIGLLASAIRNLLAK